jgi:predicted GIY-YIG superfamily endonuclease
MHKNTRWYKDDCRTEALKYTSRHEFQKNSGAYFAAWARGWLDEICKHMDAMGNQYKRLIYVFEFADHSAYVGLTYNHKSRLNNHLSGDHTSPVYKHIQNTGLQPEFKKLTDYVDVHQAITLEQKFIEQYELDNWHMLNTARGGSVGTRKLFWTKEKCLEESLKYHSKSELQKECKAAYSSAYVHGWLQETGAHMNTRCKPNGYWTKEKCTELALGYKSISEFRKANQGVYSIVCNKG